MANSTPQPYLRSVLSNTHGFPPQRQSATLHILQHYASPFSLTHHRFQTVRLLVSVLRFGPQPFSLGFSAITGGTLRCLPKLISTSEIEKFTPIARQDSKDYWQKKLDYLVFLRPQALRSDLTWKLMWFYLSTPSVLALLHQMYTGGIGNYGINPSNRCTSRKQLSCGGVVVQQSWLMGTPAFIS